VNPGGAGTQAKEEAGARGIAKWRLTMRVGEQRAACGELVDVRCFHVRMPAETADPVVLVIDGEEKDVRLAGGGGVERDGECEEGEQGDGVRVHEVGSGWQVGRRFGKDGV